VVREFLPTSLKEKQITILTSVILSNTCHLLALIPLYHLTRRIFPLQRSLPTVTCILHALSPAGAFLLAGNTESLFNFLSFSGMALFHSGARFAPAIIWGLAGTVRSNALLWAGFFAWDALDEVIYAFEGDRGGWLRKGGRIAYLGVCGVISLGGVAWWQYCAWEQYCNSSAPQEWCSSRLPLIYSHVQAKYWYRSPSPDVPLCLGSHFWDPGTSDFCDTGQFLNYPIS
jgi:GPI mannosyltransferase 2